MEQLTRCPSCNNQSFRNLLKVKDHFLSGETFNIVECVDCGLRFTNPRPFETELPSYYESEDYISHSDAKRHFSDHLYVMVRKYTLWRKYLLVKKFHNQGRILDVGCGTGTFLNYFKRKGWEAYGLEPNPGAREIATRNFGLDVRDDKEIAELEPASFDVITLWHVLEHVPGLQPRLDELVRLLKTGGLLLLALPNSGSWDAGHYGSYWAAWDVPRHLYHFTPDSVQKLMKTRPLQAAGIEPMKFDAFYISLLSEKYLHGRNRYFRALINGLRSNAAASGVLPNHSSLIYFYLKPLT